MTMRQPTYIPESDENISVRDIISETYREISGQPLSDSSNGNLSESLALGKEQTTSILKSFKHQRKRVLFLKAIETRCLVCFPHSVYEKNWSFGDFVNYVEIRREKPDVNLKLAKKRMNWNKKIQTNPIIVFAFLPLVIGLALSLPPFGVAILMALGISPILLLQYSDFTHFKRLVAALESRVSQTG